MTDDDNPDERIVLSAKVSKTAANGWQTFCAQNGISVTALLEIAGRELASETFPPSLEARQRMVESARGIDLARRTRRR